MCFVNRSFAAFGPHIDLAPIYRLRRVRGCAFDAIDSVRCEMPIRRFVGYMSNVQFRRRNARNAFHPPKPEKKKQQHQQHHAWHNNGPIGIASIVRSIAWHTYARVCVCVVLLIAKLKGNGTVSNCQIAAVRRRPFGRRWRARRRDCFLRFAAGTLEWLCVCVRDDLLATRW